MVSAPPLPNEEQRLAALWSYDILDTEFEKDYDDLCRLAASICESPMAMISLVDRDRQWFKAVVGTGVRETSRDIAFCAHTIWQDQVLEIPDATRDVRFADNPLVTGEPGIRFYAGQPLLTPEGLALGALCAVDRIPRTLSTSQKSALAILARQVVNNLELRRSLADLQKLNRDKDEFFTLIAHDLRSPFAGLLGLMDLVNRYGTDMEKEELLKHMASVRQGLIQVHGLAENLLKWAQLEQGRMSFLSEEIPVAALFEEVAAVLSEALKRKSLVLEVSDPGSLTVVGDRNMLETSLRNLVSNALKFTPSGGMIRLRATALGDWLWLSVKDTGCGLSEAQLARLREGRRVPSGIGTEGESGTGLGLTLVRQFAALHGGRLELDSSPGEGTTVSVVVPQPPAATQPVAQHS